jgi:hypothetical protein
MESAATAGEGGEDGSLGQHNCVIYIARVSGSIVGLVMVGFAWWAAKLRVPDGHPRGEIKTCPSPSQF